MKDLKLIAQAVSLACGVGSPVTECELIQPTSNQLRAQYILRLPQISSRLHISPDLTRKG